MNTMQGGAVTVRIDMPMVVDPEVAGDIEKESVFVSPKLERIRVSEDGASAVLEIRDGLYTQEVVEKAHRFVAVMAKQRTGFDIKTFASNVREDDGPFQAGVNEELVRRGWVHDYGKGQIAYNGPVLRLARLVNEIAGGLYEKHFDAVDGHFPGFIDADVLHKCGYFDSHPNQATFVGNVMEDFDAIEEFRVANSCSEGAILPKDEHLHHDGMCMNPAACFPAYPTLQGKRLDDAGFALSWLGRVFRYESRNASGLDRLYEFNVREIVFVGTEEYVGDRRRRALPLVVELAKTFDLDMEVQTATDPFFATVSASKKFFQAAMEVKNEILIPVLDGKGGTKKMACGSVNLHGRFFGEKFDITANDGEPAHTGCIGLGIERWVLAAFTQHGFDPMRWPEGVRETIFD